MVKYISLALHLCLILMFLSCSNGAKTKVPTKEPVRKVDCLGIFVYIDGAGVLHTKNGCRAVFKDHSMQVVRPVEITEVSEYNLRRICSQCVTESNILHLKDLIKAKEVTSEYEGDSTVAEYDTNTEDTEY